MSKGIYLQDRCQIMLLQQIPIYLFHDGDSYYIETSPNQWNGFYMIRTSVMKELRPCQASMMDIFAKKAAKIVKSH